MKKIMTSIVVGLLLCIALLYWNPVFRIDVKAEVKEEYLQDVPLDVVHFPDEQFRKKLGYYIDKNKDGILSRLEREKIFYLDLNSYTNGVARTWVSDMKYMTVGNYNESKLVDERTRYSLKLNFKFNEENYSVSNADKVVDLTGIEYFYNLREVKTDRYDLITGSFQNNSYLTKIWIGCPELGDKNYETIRRDFPVSQLTYMHLENIIADTLNVEKIPGLQVLRVILPDESNRRLVELNLSKNKKLKELEFGNILPDELDLSRNTKLTSVKVYSGRRRTGEKRGLDIEEKAKLFEFFLPEKDQKCSIKFAKKNAVKTFYYFTADKAIDITRLSKLEDFHTLKYVKVKVRSSWIRKTFTKRKWGCSIVKNGKFLTKVKARKKKKYTMI